MELDMRFLPAADRSLASLPPLRPCVDPFASLR